MRFDRSLYTPSSLYDNKLPEMLGMHTVRMILGSDAEPKVDGKRKMGLSSLNGLSSLTDLIGYPYLQTVRGTIQIFIRVPAPTPAGTRLWSFAEKPFCYSDQCVCRNSVATRKQISVTSC
jgi:hypothetical protein